MTKVVLALLLMAQAPAAQTIWTFDRLDNIGGFRTTVEGDPRIVDTPLGKAIEFDGVDDALWIEKHPLAGASAFTFEAIFRPDGGAFEQRWFHLAERDPKTGLLASADHPKTGQDANARFLFELRTVENNWYLDAFVNGPGYSRALMFEDKRHPIGRWYHVAQTYDGKMFRSYVDGVLQGEAEVGFRPQGEGAASLGTRINRRNYFKGAIRQARFTPRALVPDQFLKVPAQTTAQTGGDYFVYAGSYTRPTATTTSESKGIYAWRFDSKAGTLSPIGLAAEAVNPAHVWPSPDGRFLYAVNWSTGDPAGDTVSSYAVDRKTGALRFLNKVSSHGESPNQIVLDPTGAIAVTVTYNGGTVTAYGIESDGRLTEAIYTEKHAGQPLSAKQPGPRAHGIVFSKDGRWAYVAQLGLDRVYTYRVDAKKRTFAPADPPFVTMNAGGSGPRRLQLHPTGRFLYVNHETDSKVSVFEVDGANLTQIQTTSTLPPDYAGNNTTAEIQIDRTGKWLYVTNRGHDSLAHYAVDPINGTVTPAGHIPSGGRTPRNITIDPTNRYLIAANQAGNNITVFRIDPKRGHLVPTGATGQISQPGGLAFVKAQ